MAEIKIKGDISGSTTIKAPDSGSDEVVELSSALASKLPYSYGTATPSTSVDGFLWYDENDTPPTPKFWDGAAFQALTSGKILQVVRATDTTRRTITSTSYVDVTGMSVTITPQKSDSAILIFASCLIGAQRSSGDFVAARFAITDSSNNGISGAESFQIGTTRYSYGTSAIMHGLLTAIAYDTPATTSATTYKLRTVAFSVTTTEVQNDLNTGQMYAIEVSA